MDSVLDTSNAPGDIPDVDIPPLGPSDLDDEDYPDVDILPPDPFNLGDEDDPDVNIPPPHPSDIDDEDTLNLDVPQLDTAVYGSVPSDPQLATGSAPTGHNEDTQELATLFPQ